MQIADSDDKKLEFAAEIGKNIRRVLARKHLVLKYVCEKIGITQATMQNYLNGKTVPDLYTLNQIADICKVSLAEFVSETPSADADETGRRIAFLEGQIALLKEMLERKN
jgi:transcriptional regulator with XRE-family HTH domain